MPLKISLNSLYWPGSDPRLVESHKAVTKHFGLSVNYTEEKVNHGSWMTSVLESSSADIVGFFDIDCVPIKKNSVFDLIRFAAKNKSIAGMAQASNHIAPMTHVYVAPCAIFIYKPLYDALGKPSLEENKKSDVAEYLSYVAEQSGVRMRALYPTRFEKEPDEGVWRLNNYGYFGVGTVFGDDQFYHLYQSRMENNIELFKQRCDEIIAGKFDSSSFHSSTNIDYPGKICCYEPELKLKSTWINKV